MISCVNALLRAFFISTSRCRRNSRYRRNVSMPCFGLSSFLHYNCITYNETHSVSMPCFGLSSFLLNRNVKDETPEENVSMPCFGLSSFLQYPSGSPLFMRLPGPIFASNSQNILKTRIFSSFFGLVYNFPFSNTFSSMPFVCYTSRIQIICIFIVP